MFTSFLLVIILGWVGPSNATTTPCPLQPGAVTNCETWQLAEHGDTCCSLADEFQLDDQAFLGMNPQLRGDCLNNFLEGFCCIDELEDLIDIFHQPPAAFIKLVYGPDQYLFVGIDIKLQHLFFDIVDELFELSRIDYYFFAAFNFFVPESTNVVDAAYFHPIDHIEEVNEHHEYRATAHYFADMRTSDRAHVTSLRDAHMHTLRCEVNATLLFNSFESAVKPTDTVHWPNFLDLDCATKVSPTTTIIHAAYVWLSSLCSCFTHDEFTRTLHPSMSI
ncbi:Uu.00g075250.m01.CDS01 [Anthostomella pinea]|uniref:Uu.00g075250.m01.CDS01 n=1 Tax=Anthostomella pinea TaxID=933095 RepID=A0AAI8YP61_9PEZI|nr:Uu.00g075250.m01.CDS01 [Anthostomella pinea]